MKRVLLLIVFAVLVSGCTGTKGAGEVTINSFYFNPDAILGNQKTFLNLEIQNGGTFPALQTTVVLYGMSADLIVSDKLTSAEDSAEAEKKKVVFGTLNPLSSSLGSSGEKRSVKWLVEFTGNALKGQTFRHKANVRVCYLYKTEAKGKVDFITDSEYLIRKERGSISEGSTEFQSTAGPLSLTAEVPRPIITTPGKAAEFPVQVRIANVGSGFAVGSTANPCESLDITQANRANLTVVSRKDAQNNAAVQCILDKNDPNKKLDIFLKKGDSRTQTIYCTYTPSSNIPDATEELQFLLDYGYYLNAEATVAVRGT